MILYIEKIFGSAIIPTGKESFLVILYSQREPEIWLVDCL